MDMRLARIEAILSNGNELSSPTQLSQMYDSFYNQQQWFYFVLDAYNYHMSHVITILYEETWFNHNFYDFYVLFGQKTYYSVVGLVFPVGECGQKLFHVCFL